MERTMTRAALLARVSTEQQVEGLSLEAQLGLMRARCEAEGWEVVREFVAPGESAFTWDLSRRPVLREVLSAAEAGEYEVLVVHESSRLARDMEMAAGMLRRLDGCGVRLVNLQSGVDYSTPPGRLFFGVEASFNEYYSRQLSEHIRKGKRALWERGLHVGDAPFGYVRGADRNKPLQVVQAEGRAVHHAFAIRVGGAGYQAIADGLNRDGHRPRSKRGLTVFTKSSVQSLLENRFYAGWVQYRGQWRRGVHEPVISDELFEAAQRAVKAPQFGREVYLLTGVLRCGSCGGPVHRFVSDGGSGGRRRHVYYREKSAERGLSCEMAWRLVHQEVVDRQVEASLLGIRLDGAWLEEVRRLEAKAPDADGQASERRRLEGVLKRARTMWARTGDVEFERMMVETEEALSRLGPAGGSRMLQIGEALTGMLEAWDLWTPKERNELVRVVCERVTVDMGSGEAAVVPRPEYEELFRARVALVGSTPGRSRASLRHMGVYTARALGVAV